MITETVWLDHDNTIDLVLTADGSAVDLSSVTKMELEIGDDTIIDSATSADAFDWSEGDGKLILALGGETITAGTYTATLIVYDATNTDGIVWDQFTLVVRE